MLLASLACTALLPARPGPVVLRHRAHRCTCGPVSAFTEATEALGLGSAIAAAVTWWRSSSEQEGPPSSSEGTADLPVWTCEDLQKHDGSNPDLPLLLAADGLIFDVESARRLYGPGAEYAAFAGRALAVLDPSRFRVPTT